jgi:hypothetical protein
VRRSEFSVPRLAQPCSRVQVLYGPWFLLKFLMVMYELSSTVYVR